MEAILNTILSEKWVIAFLFICTLFWIYKLARWFWCRYLEMIEKYHQIKIKAEKDKDIVFLKAVSDIVEQVGKGDWMHTEEHKTINNNLLDWHAKINTKLDNIHNDIKKKK